MRIPARCRRRLVAVVVLLLAPACSAIRVTDPARTATEQFLLSQAADEAVAQLSFDPLRGRRVFVDTSYFAALEEQFVIGELRARLLLSGVQLMRNEEAAEVILEVRSSGVGIDRTDFLLGIPPLQQWALMAERDQRGVASVSYAAYWKDTGEILSASGPFLGRTRREDFWFLAFGPFTSGDVPTAAPESD